MKNRYRRLWHDAGERLRHLIGWRTPGSAEAAAPEAHGDLVAGMAAGTFLHGGRSCDYRLYVPHDMPPGVLPGFRRRARPLVLMLHGCQQDPVDFATGTRMNQQARKHGALVLYPAQAERANSQRCWNWFKPQHQHRGRGEPALLAALVREVMTQHRVDPARVYVAGLSAGGGMADVMAQTHPDLFAAVGIYAGLAAGAAHTVMSALSVMKNGPVLPLSMALASAPRMRVPAIVFQGDADNTVHPRNAERLVLAAMGGDDAGAEKNEGVSTGGRSYTRWSYASHFATRPAVEYWLVHGSGHAWSGGNAEGSYTDPAGPDASAEMMRFFMAHPGRAAQSK